MPKGNPDFMWRTGPRGKYNLYFEMLFSWLCSRPWYGQKSTEIVYSRQASRIFLNLRRLYTNEFRKDTDSNSTHAHEWGGLYTVLSNSCSKFRAERRAFGPPKGLGIEFRVVIIWKFLVWYGFLCVMGKGNWMD